VDDREETHDAHATSSSSMNLITMNMVWRWIGYEIWSETSRDEE
jgi:hypothetical protein